MYIMASNTTETRDIKALNEPTGNIYESVAILSKRSNQVASKIKEELAEKLAEFTPPVDSLEEVYENKEQIELSRQYERMPKPTLQALDEFEQGKLFHRNPEREKRGY